MKKTLPAKKLVLNSETIRQLNESQLANAAGGITTPGTTIVTPTTSQVTNTCPRYTANPNNTCANTLTSCTSPFGC